MVCLKPVKLIVKVVYIICITFICEDTFEKNTLSQLQDHGPKNSVFRMHQETQQFNLEGLKQGANIRFRFVLSEIFLEAHRVLMLLSDSQNG